MVIDCFKLSWEQSQTMFPLDMTLAQQLLSPFTREKIIKLERLSGGYANSNFKCSFEKKPPLVIRIYTREESDLSIEKNILSLLPLDIPKAQILYHEHQNEHMAYPFIVMPFLPGILMRDGLLHGTQDDVEQISFQAGKLLTKLQRITFSKAGFFGKNHEVVPLAADQQTIPFLKSSLTRIQSKQLLPEVLIDQLFSSVESSKDLLDEHQPACLVHGDFDPSNIIVSFIDNVWQVEALLDWEFALAGNFLFDVGHMMRYAHRLDPCFGESFVRGLQSEGVKLPKDWKRQSMLLDLMSLLQFCTQDARDSQPNRFKDVKALLEHTAKSLHALL